MPSPAHCAGSDGPRGNLSSAAVASPLPIVALDGDRVRVRGGRLLGNHHALERGTCIRRSQPWRTNRARALRANETSAEEKLWAELRNRQLAGLKFVRQAAIGPHFVDFLCREHDIVVEIDGGTHGTEAEIAADRTRERELERRGFRIFRAWNDDIFENIDGVLDGLLTFVEVGA